MPESHIYLDHAATTPVDPMVADSMSEVLTTTYGNPSSLHRLGLAAERRIKEARELIAGALDVSSDSILFTSGGTESNNLALRGVARAYAGRGRHIITTAVEHSSVLATVRDLEKQGWQVDMVGVDRAGRVDPQEVLARLTPETVLVSVMALNNEVGTIQPVEAIGQSLAARSRDRRTPLFFHVDAVQAFAKIPVHPRRWHAQLVSISAHKIHGPKGIGALYRDAGVRLTPLQTGGEQEVGLRPGTENVPGIVGFGQAISLAPGKFGSFDDRASAMDNLKSEMVQRLRAAIPDLVINGPEPEASDAAPHIVNIYIPGLKGEMLVHHLEAAGIYVSTGSACTSRRAKPSHVLAAMGQADAARDGSLRISLSPVNDSEDAAALAETLAGVSRRLRRMFSR